MIHHTMGVYLNGERKHNGVASEELAAHIRYNLDYRPGRALFVDGCCLNRGYLDMDLCAKIEAELKERPVKMIADTAPYQ